MAPDIYRVCGSRLAKCQPPKERLLWLMLLPAEGTTPMASTHVISFLEHLPGTDHTACQLPQDICLAVLLERQTVVWSAELTPLRRRGGELFPLLFPHLIGFRHHCTLAYLKCQPLHLNTDVSTDNCLGFQSKLLTWDKGTVHLKAKKGSHTIQCAPSTSACWLHM